jgi:rare lipoprotein A
MEPIEAHIIATVRPYAAIIEVKCEDELLFRKLLIAAAVMSAFTLVTSDMTYASGNQCGVASWYALSSRTASGERMNPNAMTAAHKSLPLGTVVKVIDQKSGRSIKVRINDRGPYVRGRIIDLSRAAAKRLGLHGLGKVCIAQV